MRSCRKIYYIPGMISLITLPVLCYYYLYPFPKEERAFEVVFAAKYEPGPGNLPRFDTSFLSNPQYKRNYLEIRFTGNKGDDKIKLDFFRLRIREMIKNNDTKYGVHLLFVDSATYGTFVESLNICKKEGLLTYALFENNLWAIQLDLDKAHIERIKKIRQENEERNKQVLINVLREKLSFKNRLSSVKKVWPVFLILLILSYLSVRRTIRRAKNSSP